MNISVYRDNTKVSYTNSVKQDK